MAVTPKIEARYVVGGLLLYGVWVLADVWLSRFVGDGVATAVCVLVLCMVGIRLKTRP
jgi:hypothetical protein